MNHSLSDLRSLSRDALEGFLTANGTSLRENEVLAILDNPNCGTSICHVIAQARHLTSFYSVRFRLVQHRATPLVHAVKLVHYLYWPDLVRLSVDVTVPAQVRHAVETQLLQKVNKLSLGERIASAKRCSAALIRVFLFDRDPKVFAALLVNQRLREEDLLLFAESKNAAAENLELLAADRKWSFRYAIRKALVTNPATPRAAAALQLRFLSERDLVAIHGQTVTSIYLRRCIERLRTGVFVRMAPDELGDQGSEIGDQELSAPDR